MKTDKELNFKRQVSSQDTQQSGAENCYVNSSTTWNAKVNDKKQYIQFSSTDDKVYFIKAIQFKSHDEFFYVKKFRIQYNLDGKFITLDRVFQTGFTGKADEEVRVELNVFARELKLNPFTWWGLEDGDGFDFNADLLILERSQWNQIRENQLISDEQFQYFKHNKPEISPTAPQVVSALEQLVEVDYAKIQEIIGTNQTKLLKTVKLLLDDQYKSFSTLFQQQFQLIQSQSEQIELLKLEVKCGNQTVSELQLNISDIQDNARKQIVQNEILMSEFLRAKSKTSDESIQTVEIVQDVYEYKPLEFENLKGDQNQAGDEVVPTGQNKNESEEAETEMQVETEKVWHCKCETVEETVENQEQKVQFVLIEEQISKTANYESVGAEEKTTNQDD